MNKKQILAATSIVVLALATGIGWYVHRHGENKRNETAVYVNPVEQLIDPAADTGGINCFSGVVETQKQIRIQPEQERTVKEILVEEGQEVKQGTVLFTYNIEEEKNKLSRLELEKEKIENDIKVKQSTVKAAEETGDRLEILQAETELKQSEYEKEVKQLEIDKLSGSLGNEEVKSQIDGIVKSVNRPDAENTEEDSSAMITLIALGNYRIRGKVNEQNMASITEGQPVIIHARTDETLTWSGKISEVDMKNPSGNDASGSEESSLENSSSYSFYVDPDQADGLMLGQHVYMEADFGQGKQRDGIWLDESYVVTEDGMSFVWAEDGHGKLEKRKVSLGEHDEELYRVEIRKGLKEEDEIAFPEPDLKEGAKTAKGGMQ